MSLFKSATVISAWTLLSRVTGLLREWLIAANFGATALTDAFNVAFRIPNLFRRFFAEGAFSQAFVPVLSATRAQQGDEATHRLIDRVTSLLALLLVALSVAGVLAAPWLVWAMASGLSQSAQARDVAVVLTRWMFPYIAFMSLVALAAGVLNTWQRFAVSAATPVLLNVAMSLAAALGAPWLAGQGVQPIYALAGGVLVGGVAQLAAQFLALARLGLTPRLRWSPSALREAWQDAGVRRMRQLMAPALLGVGVAQLSMLINTQIASLLKPGSVSWITYADRLMEFPTALLGVALGAVLMPHLATARAADDAARYSDLLDWGLRLVLVLAAPCALALLLLDRPLVALLYHYGAMTAGDVDQIAAALRGWGVGLLGLVALKVLAPAYYAREDTRTPVRVALAVLVLTQLFNALLVPWLAHAALTLSIGLGALLNAAWLLRGLLRRGTYIPRPGWRRLLLQVALACLVMGAGLVWAAQAWDWTAPAIVGWRRIGLLAPVLIAAAAIYFVALGLLGVPLRQFTRR